MSDFELVPEDLPFLLGEAPSPEEIQAGHRRASDRQLLRRGAAAAKAFQPLLEAALTSFRRSHPELCEGLSSSGQAYFRPAPTKGHSAVLMRLIQVILSPASATRTQKECRQIVETEFPNHAVYKTWTKPLPPWAVSRAKAMLAGSPPPISSLKIKAGVTLKDLHNAVRAAVEGKGTQATVVLAVTEDAVLVNGHRFARTMNRVKGKEYPIARMAIPALEAALRSKPKAT
ncbi:MAG TPA: hypothetical protein VF522_04035 [Ramlibacter sp.]|uniref:hypothetical protein n=1 Tax=Ramlibacter sp. TaxID=1917967 RepID=UPI002ED3F48A